MYAQYLSQESQEVRDGMAAIWFLARCFERTGLATVFEGDKYPYNASTVRV